MNAETPRDTAMHPADISAALKKVGSSQAKVARSLTRANGEPISHGAVHLVVSGCMASARIAQRISELTGIPVAQLWPGRYPDLELPPHSIQESRMTPYNALVTELLLAADKADGRAAQLREKHDAGLEIPFGTLEDNRAELIGDLLEAIDRVQPGLGTRLLNAMHPLTSDEDATSGVPA